MDVVAVAVVTIIFCVIFIIIIVIAICLHVAAGPRAAADAAKAAQCSGIEDICEKGALGWGGIAPP